ncbi:hypothetical protein [Mesomycoplasma dispar]|nr:hypothetical protein [Mesomycoplasma dispar]
MWKLKKIIVPNDPTAIAANDKNSFKRLSNIYSFSGIIYSK